MHAIMEANKPQILRNKKVMMMLVTKGEENLLIRKKGQRRIRMVSEVRLLKEGQKKGLTENRTHSLILRRKEKRGLVLKLRSC